MAYIKKVKIKDIKDGSIKEVKKELADDYICNSLLEVLDCSST